MAGLAVVSAHGNQDPDHQLRWWPGDAVLSCVLPEGPLLLLLQKEEERGASLLVGQHGHALAIFSTYNADGLGTDARHDRPDTSWPISCGIGTYAQRRRGNGADAGYGLWLRGVEDLLGGQRMGCGTRVGGHH